MTSAPTSGTKDPDVIDVGDRLTRRAGNERAYTIVVAVRGSGSDKQFLMVRHAERGWELPGGKMEAKEGPVRCALREFREETGHLVSDPKFVLKLEKPNGMCYVFTGGLGAKVAAVAPEESIEEMDWFDRLPEPSLLAFPDDPYDAIGQAIGVSFRP